MRSSRARTWAIGRHVAPREVELFEPGASLDDVLDQLRGRGNFLCPRTDTRTGEEVALIEFSIDSDPTASILWHPVLWAVFRDGRFEKFVPALEAIYESAGGAQQLRRLSLRATLERVDGAAGKKALDARRIPSDFAPDSGGGGAFDPVLTVIALPFLIVSTTLSVVFGTEDAVLVDNAAYRERFDVRAVPLGQARVEVEARLGAPVLSWPDGGADVAVYRGSRRFDLLPGVRHAPVVVAYEGGSVRAAFGYALARSLIGSGR